MKLEYKLDIDDHKYIQTIEKGKKYRIEIPTGVNIYGKKSRAVARVNGTFDVALAKRNEMLKSIANGSYQADKSMTFGELCNFFLEDNQPVYVWENGKNVKKSGLSYASLKTYKTYINNYLIPGIGHLKICNITKDTIDQLYKALELYYKTKNDTHLSPCTMGHIHSDLRAILNFAYKKGLIENNPIERLEEHPTVKCPERQCYNPEQLKEILKADITISKFVGNHEFYKKRFKAFTRVAIYGCLRRSEISGLNWDDIIENDYALKISRSASSVTGQGLTLLETKNESSEDIIVVGKDTIDALLKYKEEIELIFGDEMTGKGQAIFISQSGNRLAPQALNDMWNNYINTTDLPKYTLHVLRHSGATYLYNLTKDIKGTSKHLRHSNTSTTEDVYVHSDIDNQKQLISLMQQGLTDKLQSKLNINIPKEALDKFMEKFILEFSKEFIETN